MKQSTIFLTAILKKLNGKLTNEMRAAERRGLVCPHSTQQRKHSEAQETQCVLEPLFRMFVLLWPHFHANVGQRKSLIDLRRIGLHPFAC